MCIGCVSQNGTDNKVLDVHHFESVEIKYAEGFTIEQNDSFFELSVKSLSEKYPFSDHFLVKKFDHLNEINRIACQSSTYVAFLNKLNSLETLCGLSDMNYLPPGDLTTQIRNLKVEELSNNGAVGIERLVNTDPDLFLMYPFELKSEKYKDVGIPTLLVSEYLESSVIGRLEWLKFFGCLVNKTGVADSIFDRVSSEYNQLITPVDSQQTIVFNLPFKDNWNMPSKGSLTANLLKDAGFYYPMEETGADNLVLPKEKVWNLGIETAYWIIIASRPVDYTLTDLIGEEPVYSEFKSVKSGQVIFCNTSHSSYFTEGVVEPDIMLKDLLFLTGKIKDHKPKYFKLLND